MLAAIGEIATESANVDDLLRQLFARLIDSPYGEVIAAGEDTARICQLCARVAQYNLTLSDDQIQEQAAILRAIDEVRPLRNFMVHARWENTRLSGKHAGVRSARPSPKSAGGDISEVAYWTTTEAGEVAEAYRTIAERLDRFADRSFPA